ncbi:hypothetical protein C1I98_03605 [Spongiactinospora gelatinilytica]|uniref:Uncharacterized protein n=1 Tax=Spongiactinospora gelatinilytica TaxID=2666298 RepID=A0A2W2IB07_9ACTN|nr:hypothetical protein [Spongiactinospora gelatinilytica]PZG55347.1 hypothetical protein C1I98_03605 [Spongiactinospora gelatinilytica]
MRTWLAGILGAVIVAAIGIVFTDWFNTSGPDTVERISGQPPLTIGHVAVDYTTRHTTLRRPVTDPGERALLLGAGSGSSRDAIMASHDWAPLGTTDVTAVLAGNRSSLRIIDIIPRVLARKPVSDGALFVYAPEGVAKTIELSADLDQPAPRFTTTRDTTEDTARDPGTSYFRKKQIDLKRDEPVTLVMSITGSAAYYEFDLQVTVLAEGDRTEQITIKGPDGRPFRVSGIADRYRAYYGRSALGGWQPLSRAAACAKVEKNQKPGEC